MKKCEHELWERETACADGYCPICLRSRCVELIQGIEELLADFSHHLPLHVVGGLQELLEGE